MIIFFAGCGRAECHFEYDLRGDGATYSVCADGRRVKL
jgi:hypothetical protein